ncbi:uncharacterized protein LOC134529530 isoform X2 [Bacillus rossius redtenbacheri]|uniref:uncharacterized protein LOC134529530 isoform X2 n=1 Tax=Bacillus rossius redtenbacheri TaxID=93214 RepID=UPI002FDEB621
MISFYVDPQWCGVLFSVYWKNDKGYLFTGGTTPQLDPLATTAFAEPLDVDWITFAGNVGFEIYHLSSSWAVVLDAAKVTGVLLLLGFGSLVGYRILKYLWLSRFSDDSEPPSPSMQHNVTVSLNRSQLLEDVEYADLNDVEVSFLNCTAATYKSHLCSRGIQREIISQHDRLVSENLMPFLLYLQESSPWPYDITPSDVTCELGWLVKKLMHLVDFQESYRHRKNLNEFSQNVANTRNSGNINEKMCYASPRNTTRGSPFLPRYCREDSCEFSAHTHREGSFDSTCSEFSLDFTLPESCENTNIINLDKLQLEIDKLKSNCQMMDEELETIKCNRNLPGLSSLMETNVSETNFTRNEDGLQSPSASSEALKQKNARACFAGLYSLTTIINSSSDLSDLSECGNKMVESTESLEWDSPQSVVTSAANTWDQVPDKHFPQPNRSVNVDNSRIAVTACEKMQDDYISQEISSQSKSVRDLKVPSNEHEMTLDLEWDEDDLVSDMNNGDENFNSMDLGSVQLCSPSASDGTSEINNIMYQHTRCKDNQYKLHPLNTTNGNNLEPTSPQLQDCDNDCVMNASKYSKESGYLEWDEETEFSLQELHGASSTQATPESDFPPLSNSTDAIYMQNEQYVGSRTNIYQYALQLCQGNSQKGETLLKGFAEIPSLTGLQNLRQIHRDSYCIIRAAIFQGLSSHCQIPCGRTAFQSLSEAFNSYNFTWLQNWNFSMYLPYQGKEVLHGMRMCLHTLDNVMSVLSSREDSGDTLALLLNSDRSLDIHVMEAVKLHLLLQSIKLYQSYTSGGNVPGFVDLMFAHESCRTPKEFMDNHLQNLGESANLHEMVISLLGYTLNMKICVIYPALIGTDKFVSYFPQCNISSFQHEVVFVEDEDCCCVLVK